MVVSEVDSDGGVRVASIVVVVPVRNEQRLLAGCLSALRDSAGEVTVPVRIQLVLDACTDRSARVADATGADVLHIDARNVGAARAAGFAAAGTGCGSRTWFATTDADSRVDRSWLTRQLRYARTGVGLVVGAVTVSDWDEHRPEVRDRYEDGYRAQRSTGHIHGASLGFRADLYWRAGGFAHLATGEDVDLVDRIRVGGAAVAWAEDVVAVTSGRRFGRAPQGFAAHLRGLQPSSETGNG
ncbi:glycosyltransferase [Nocardia sp. alder85J]|uniref:glycosyltransferase n=1 Tax=Nocardia sp. alder85J TaxID=2862949 RepID=UPI001CD6B9D4|nr:glycosyltransferase [Nocardia sp. alder85J]MCX4098580.1 glycosyltransferase [Nocardia sp. alder85J]